MERITGLGTDTSRGVARNSELGISTSRGIVRNGEEYVDGGAVDRYKQGISRTPGLKVRLGS
jgi:hypothetical protein